jgi:hypothetical protein
MSIAKLRANVAQHEYATGLVRADLEKAVGEYDSLCKLIYNFTDANDCHYDHHGFCQAHNWFHTDPTCPHARAKAILALVESEVEQHG